MSLLDVVLEVVAVVGGLHLASVLVFVGRDRLVGASRTVRSTVLDARGPLIVLLSVLALNGVVRRIGVELSWVVGANVTGAIYALEGTFVATVQSYATPTLTAYFAFVYVFGYVYLLTFPPIAYALRGEGDGLRRLLIAYGLNYGIGLVCYVLFVAYGPRNLMPELVDSLLFESWPRSQLLTSQVNENTNVFPSLHTSLAATVALVTWRERSWRRWTPVALVLATSIVVSTMYLGIHWATDVVAGIALAAGSVAAAERIESGRDRPAREDAGPPNDATDRDRPADADDDRGRNEGRERHDGRASE
ncbi:phosphatase PAP2 family protein [Halobaculum magnesiiphilum]|uniref:Phosphatase PAP2 family protein n=1 Tax=Halobaculum magnesiiphilum TaxID=1017351 RepID=A0A8T8WAB9_9EURY|nr:phosphatase PAP2 family protein [Halobaculum magnesiiphilum]QZP36768.1 phosphatase PAP2 family protein [Halobaculum magnesiiphilum]